MEEWAMGFLKDHLPTLVIVMAAVFYIDQSMDSRFDRVDARFGEVDNRLDDLSERMARVETKVDNIDQRLVRVEGILDGQRPAPIK